MVKRWRLIRDEPRSGSRNMAVDHALAECLPEHEGVLRMYGWERPTISFGRNETVCGLYAGGRHGGDRGAYVRRPTGGRAVSHDQELTYAVAVPLAGPWVWREAYGRINEALAAALRSLAAPVELATGGNVPSPDAGPCFSAPAPGEVVARGRKLVGSAQARIGRSLLQHGSILLDGDQSLLGARAGSPPVHDGSVTLRELIGDVSIDEVAEAVAKSLRRRFGGTWASTEYTADEVETADLLESERYAKESWTWRR